MSQQILFRRDTSTNWSTTNPILAQGEMGLDLTNSRFKIGDGSTAWNSLAYVTSVDATALKIANNLSDLNNIATARTNLGLGTAATQSSSSFDTAGAASTVQTNLNTHTSNVSNPHSVTQAQVGLSNVDNTSDLNKPISTATQTALNAKVAGNSSITPATNLKITYDAKGLVTAGTTASLNDLNNVSISGPITDEILKYNGVSWVNGAQTNVNAGAGVNYFLTATSSGIGSPTYDFMSKTPDTAAEVDESVVVNNQTLLFESYIADGAIGGTQLDPGIWNFSLYTYSSLSTGTNTITANVYKRTSGGTETLLFSVTSSNIINTVVELVELKTVQPAFSINATDTLLFKFDATTTNITNTTIHLVHSGTIHYSFINTPLIARHNDLAGLQGGSSNEFYHLNNTEYTGTGTGTFVRSASPTLTGNITINGSETFGLDGIQQIISQDSSKARNFSWSSTASGDLYTLVGDYIMWGTMHNFTIDGSGNFVGRDDTDACELFCFTEGGEYRYYYAPSASVGSVPTFTLSCKVTSSGFEGPVGGDLSGTILSATVTKLQGHNISTTAPTDKQLMRYNNSTSQWEPFTLDSTSVTTALGLTPIADIDSIINALIFG